MVEACGADSMDALIALFLLRWRPVGLSWWWVAMWSSSLVAGWSSSAVPNRSPALVRCGGRGGRWRRNRCRSARNRECSLSKCLGPAPRQQYWTQYPGMLFGHHHTDGDAGSGGRQGGNTSQEA